MNNASLYESVVRLKSNIFALRSVYNDAAPLHRRLPREILLEIFANFHHDGTRRGHPAFRVCHSWHALLQHSPQLWKTLLDQELLVKWEPQWKINRFKAAFLKSIPLNLHLCLRGIDRTTVDIIAPHMHRISSITIHVVARDIRRQWEALDLFLSHLDGPLRELEIRTAFEAFYIATSKAHIIRFSAFQHLHTLRLSHIYCEPPQTLHTALRHLEMNCCWGVEHSLFDDPSVNIDLPTILAIIKKCPNLETLRITGWPPNTLSNLDSPVDVPRLRHIFLQISPESTAAFLLHLILPSTVLLDLEPRYTFRDDLLPLPLSTGLVSTLGRPPVAEVAMDLKFLFNRHRPKNVATWEARGDGSRPLRVSTFLRVDFSSYDQTLAYTNQVLGIYATGTAVTSLTIAGARRASPDYYWPPNQRPSLNSYWATLLAGLPHLTRLSVDGGDVRHSPTLLALLAKGQRDGGCLCPVLADMSVFWDERVTTPPSTALPLATESDEPPDGALLNPDKMSFRQPYGDSETHAYCRMWELCLCSRAEHGCRPLRTLSVSMWDYWRASDRRNAGYEATLAVETLLRQGLQELVGEVSVRLQSDWEV